MLELLYCNLASPRRPDTFQHLPFGPVKTLSYGNGLTLSRSYDQDYRLAAQAVGSLQNLGYGHDNAGNLQTLTDHLNAANSQTYSYDPLDRLLTAGGTQQFSYSYDAVGNRTTALRDQAQTDYHYDLSSQKLLSLTGTPAASVGYAPQGHVSQYGNQTLNYAADQRLASVEQGNTNLGSYRYDAFGHRIGKTTALSNTNYGYDQQDQLISESQGSSAQHTVYFDGQPLARIDGNNATSPIVYFHNNHLGAPQTVSDQTQQSVWTAQIDPFGQATTVNPNLTQNLRFPGQYYDQETGLHYNYNRYYQPELGRYLQSDPIGLAGGINTYAYAYNNPLRWTDPLGLAPGDKYPSQDQAGYDAACDANPLSKDENLEYAGSIYKNEDGTYSYTEPKPGGPDWSNPMNSLPQDNSPVTAWYHTHGAYDPLIGPGNFRFSPEDRQTSDATGKPNYMADPGDNAHRYDPDPLKRGKGNTKNFKNKCGCQK